MNFWILSKFLVCFLQEMHEGFLVLNRGCGGTTEVFAVAFLDTNLEKCRTFLILYLLKEFFEIFLGVAAIDVVVSESLCNGREVDGETDGGLTAYGVVGTVVEDHVDVVLGGLLCYDGHTAHVHDGGTVAVETPDGAVGLLEGDAQGYLGGVTHGADGQEVALMALIHLGAILKELAAYHACGGDDGILVA